MAFIMAPLAGTRARSVQNFHIPLPADLYAKLREAAQATGQPATVVARAAIEAWLRERRRTMVNEAIAMYATATAGSTADLDLELEAASLEQWQPRRRRGKG